jgi:hypothetical protein
MDKQSQLEVEAGPRRVPPLRLSTTPGDKIGDFLLDDLRVLIEPRVRAGERSARCRSR